MGAVFAKLKTLHAKNQFSFAVVAGNLFGDATAQTQHADDLKSLLKGQIEVPLTTYFALGHHALPSSVVDRLRADEEICTNLHFLGRRTTFKTTDGIRIVALGGEHKETTDESDDFSPSYTDTDAKVLRGASSADLLITSDWPKNVASGSSTGTGPSESTVEQQVVADLCSRLRPRYHFTVGQGFFEREPFFHNREDETAGFQLTRFLSLAPFGNADKQKWIYAFSLDTKAALPVSIPAGTTVSPLQSSDAKKRKAPETGQTFSRFNSHDGYNDRRRGKKSRGPPPMPSECFFCLSSPTAATHLITSIGENAYLTTAKGPLTTAKTFDSLYFPGHMLIIPLSHSPCASAITDADSRRDTVREMTRYRKAIQSMLAARSTATPLGAVTWEISRAGGIHFHQQLVPVDRSLITKGLVEAAFKVQAENESYPAFERSVEPVSADDDEAGEREDYFRVWVSSCAEGEEDTVLTLRLDADFRFDLQFARRVLAQLLGLEGRMDWRNCGQTVEEETADAEAFKVGFAEWDFAAE